MYFNLSCLLKKLKSILKTPKTCIQSGKKKMMYSILNYVYTVNLIAIFKFGF